MNKQQILGIGLSGLVGSRVVELLGDSYQFTDVSRKTGTDITNAQQVRNVIQSSTASTIFHFAAKTDVDGCEQGKNLGKESDAWKINVLGTQHVVDACKQTGKKLVYISTDMVFSGDLPLGQYYTEEDNPNPQNWYATTKYEAEKAIQDSGIAAIIMRIAYPYRANFEKKEYVRIFKSLLESGEQIRAVEDHYYTPTFIDDIPSVIKALLEKNETGIFHVAGQEAVSPYMVAVQVAKKFDLDESLITKTTRAEYFKDKAIRGFNLSLKDVKISKLGIKMHSFSEGLEEIKKQII